MYCLSLDLKQINNRVKAPQHNSLLWLTENEYNCVLAKIVIHVYNYAKDKKLKSTCDETFVKIVVMLASVINLKECIYK